MSRGSESRTSAGNSQNPFVGYQTFYMSLFANLQTPLDSDGTINPKYIKGVTDTMHFRTTLALDGEMQKNPAILEACKDKKTGKEKKTYDLSYERVVSGFLKSVSVVEEEVDGKPSEKIVLVLFDPEAKYDNPFKDIDQNNPRNGTTVGAQYIIKSSLTMKGKEMINKLSNYDPNIMEQIRISVVNAKSKDSDYKEDLIIKDKKVFNIYVKQGETKLEARFGDPSSPGVTNAHIVQDDWNDEYLMILGKYKNQMLRVSIDDLFSRYIKTVLSGQVNQTFLAKLNAMGYGLVPDGNNQDGSPKLKYVKFDDGTGDSTIAGYLDPTQQKNFQAEIESSFPQEEPVYHNDDDLPF